MTKKARDNCKSKNWTLPGQLLGSQAYEPLHMQMNVH